MTQIWAVEVSDRKESNLVWERFNVTAKSAADALKKAAKHQTSPRRTRITKVALVAEAP